MERKVKTVIARFSEVKELGASGKFTGVDAEGEAIDINRIDTALKRVGISLKDYINGQKGLDDVFLELASKWDTLDMATQRYIATQAAGSRQQSRFLAMMSDYGRTMELVGAANNSASASQEQFDKTLDSLESKLAQLKNAWDTFMMNLANNELIKGVIDVLTAIINAMNGLVKVFKTVGSVLGDEFAGLFAMLGAGIVLTGAIGIGKQIVFGILKGMKSSWKAFENSAVADAAKTGSKTGKAEANAHIIAYMQKTGHEHKKGNAVVPNEGDLGLGADEAGTGKTNPFTQQFKGIKDFLTSSGGLNRFVGGFAGAAIGTMLVRAATQKIFDSYDNTSEKIANLDEASSQAKKGLEQVNSEISSLASKKNDIKGLVEEMGKLSTSSAEYAQKLYEVSQEMDAIRMKSPEVFNNAKNYDTIDGVQVLNDEGWAEYYNSLTKKQTDLRNMELSATAEANRLKAREASENAGVRTKGVTAKEEKSIMGHATGGALVGGLATAAILASIASGPVGWIAGLISLGAAVGTGALTGGIRAWSANSGMDESQMADVARLAQEEGFSAVSGDIEGFISKVKEAGISTEGLREWIEKDAEAFDEHTRAIATSDASEQSNRQLAAGISSQLRTEGKSQGLDEWQTKALALKQVENNSYLRQQAEAAGNVFENWLGNASNTKTNYISGAEEQYKKIAKAYNYKFDPTNANKPLLDAQGQVVELTHLQLANMIKEIEYQELLKEATEGLYKSFGDLELSLKDILLANYAFEKGILDNAQYLGEVQKSRLQEVDLEERRKQVKAVEEVQGKKYSTGYMSLSDLDPVIKTFSAEAIYPIIKQSLTDEKASYKDADGQEWVDKSREEVLKNLGEYFQDNFTWNASVFAEEYGYQFEGIIPVDLFNAQFGFIAEQFEEEITNVAHLAENMKFERKDGERDEDFSERFLTEFEKFLPQIPDYTSKQYLLEIGQNVGAMDTNGDFFGLNKSSDKDNNKLFNDLISFVQKGEVDDNTLAAISASKTDFFSILSVSEGNLRDSVVSYIKSQSQTEEGLRKLKDASSLTADAFESIVKTVDSTVDKINDAGSEVVSFSKEEISSLTNGLFGLKEEDFFRTGADEYVYEGDLSTITTLLTDQLGVLTTLAGGGFLNKEGQDLYNALTSPESFKEGGKYADYENERIDPNKSYYTGSEIADLMGWFGKDQAGNITGGVSDLGNYLGMTSEAYNILKDPTHELYDKVYAEWSQKLTDFLTAGKQGSDGKMEEANAQFAASVGGGGQITLDVADANKGTVSEGFLDEALNANLKNAGKFEEAERAANSFEDKYRAVVKALVLENSRAEKSFESLADKIKDNEEALSGQKGSEAYLEAIDGIVAEARAAFGNSSAITHEFVKNNLNDFIDFSNGVEGATERIQEALVNELLKGNTKADKIREQLEGIEDLDFTVDGQANFDEIFEALVELMNGAENAKKFLNTLGYSVTYQSDGKGGYTATLQNSFAQGLGGTKGKTSKGSSSSWENSYDWLIDKLGQINKLLKERNDLERIHERMLAHDNISAEDIRNSLASQIANIRNVRTQQGEVYQERINRLYSYAQDNQKYNKYAWVEDGEIRYDWNAINSIKSASTGEKVDKYISELQDIRDKADEAKDSYEEQTDLLYDIAKEAKQQYADMEQRIYDAIVSQAEKEIEELQNIDSSINDTNSKLLSDVQNLISEQRQMRENSEKEKELRDKQTKLNYMRMDTTGGNRTEILSLEKELAGEEQDYTDTLVDQKISELQKQNEEASYQRQQQIEAMQAQLEVAKVNGSIAQRSEELLQSMTAEGGAETVKAFLQSAEGWDALTNSAKEQWANDFNDSLANIQTYLNGESGLPDLREGIQAVEDALRNKDWTYTTINKTIIEDGERGKSSYPGDDLTPSGIPKSYIERLRNEGRTEELITYNGNQYLWSPVKQDFLKAQTFKDIGITQSENWNDATKASTNNSTNKPFEVEHNKKKYKYYNGLYYGPFKTGGLADFTGPAWLDGTPTHPELILNARDTENFIQLRDVLANSGIADGTYKLGGDTYIQVEVQVDELASDYDVDQLVERIKHDISQDAQYRNSNIVTLFR